jgi:TatD DNase family protein
VVIHNREAMEDVWVELHLWQAALTASGSPLASRPGVLHAFDGDLPTAMRALEKGFFIGIAGPVTFKNASDRHQVAAGLPEDRILIETDAPFLTPHPHRGRWPNEPAFVPFVAERIAALRQQPVEEIARITWENAAVIFDWGANS